MKTLESNKKIAEFMGYTFDRGVIIASPENTPLSTIEPEYNKDWNALMPVIEKIESMAYKVDIKGDYRMGRHNTIDINGMGVGDYSYTTFDPEVKSKLELAYRAVLDFIEWHTQRTTKL